MARRAEFNDAGLHEAVQRLRAADVVAFATETVYGLGADTFSEAALKRVYDLKGRPRDNPLIAHVATVDQARELADEWPDAAESLARAFWPGPLTLVLARRSNVPNAATAGRPTIAVRCPAHDGAQRLLRAFNGPISAPSANRSSHVSPTTAEHVLADYADEPDLLVLDGGPCGFGLESTVVDLTGTALPRLLRPGSVSAEQLEAALGPIDTPHLDAQAASPGTRRRHYAPRTPTELIDRTDLAERLRTSRARVGVLRFAASLPDADPIPDADTDDASDRVAITLPADPDEAGRRLFDALRQLDARGVDRLLIESPPADPAWRAVRDRLLRATAADRPDIRGD